MLTLKVSNVYPITAGASPVRAGTIGLWFSVAGTATVTTAAGEAGVVVGGQVGTFFECPITHVTAVAGATVLGVLGR